jgi:hypothetical protein
LRVRIQFSLWGASSLLRRLGVGRFVAHKVSDRLPAWISDATPPEPFGGLVLVSRVVYTDPAPHATSGSYPTRGTPTGGPSRTMQARCDARTSEIIDSELLTGASLLPRRGSWVRHLSGAKPRTLRSDSPPGTTCPMGLAWALTSIKPMTPEPLLLRSVAVLTQPRKAAPSARPQQ